MNLEERIINLEKIVGGVPGTILQKNLKEIEYTGSEWTLGIGKSSCPKIFFKGDIIEECVQKAEKLLINKNIPFEEVLELFLSGEFNG